MAIQLRLVVVDERLASCEHVLNSIGYYSLLLISSPASER
jgi:hypothetical protein